MKRRRSGDGSGIPCSGLEAVWMVAKVVRLSLGFSLYLREQTVRRAMQVGSTARRGRCHAGATTSCYQARDTYSGRPT